MRRTSFSLVVGLLLLIVTATFGGTPQEANFVDEVFVSNGAFDQTTGIAWAPDGSNRLFVGLKGGAIRIIENGSLLGTSFYTETNVYTGSECGLIGICFDRRFNTGSPYLYAFLTYNAGGGNEEQMIVRYNATANTASNRQVILSGLPTVGNNHDGGAIGMGPDNHIYFAIGDLGNGTGLNLDTSTLASKVGRCEPDGSAPIDNPFYNAGDGISDTDFIWSGGYRNPFTLTFHPVTGDMWLNVVGTSWEQIFLVNRTDHGGWNNYEGGNQPAGQSAAPYGVYIDPKITYRTNNSPFGGCVTGGAFYDGGTFPAAYQNNFFWGDYNSGKIMRSVLDGAGQNVTNTTEFVTGVSRVVDIAVGPDGHLYYGRRTGQALRRVRYTGTVTQNILVTTTSLTVNEGSSNTFGVRLAAQPGSNITVNIAETSGNADVTGSPSTLTFTPGNWDTNQTVTVSAAEDPDTANEGATITASSTGLTDQNVVITVIDNDTVNTAPTASITQPFNGATVSGTTSEFFGDGTDDVAPIYAEFWVDGSLEYTDNAAGGHYHYGGTHNLWDTTQYSDGQHTLEMRVYDGGGLSGSHIITVTVDNSANTIFQQDTGSDGIVSMEAENYQGTANQTGDTWVPDTSFAGYSGSRALRALPDDGDVINTGYAGTSPQLNFVVNFVQTGTHYVWIRGYGPDGSADSVHVGLDGAEVATATRIGSFPTGYNWLNGTMDATIATINVATAGVHVVNVWMREDGFVFDKIVLTTNAGYTPTGNGPAESPRGGGGGGTDTDGDGMPDAWEITYGLNPNDASDAAGDLDGDGYTNLQEYLGGTDPTNAASPGGGGGGGGGSGSGGCGGLGLEALFFLLGAAAFRRSVRKR